MDIVEQLRSIRTLLEDDEMVRVREIADEAANEIVRLRKACKAHYQARLDQRNAPNDDPPGMARGVRYCRS